MKDCIRCVHYEREERSRWCSYQGEQILHTAGGCRSFECHCDGEDPDCECAESKADAVADEQATRDMEGAMS